MSKIKRIFKIIKDYFYSIFNKQKVELIEETTTTSNSTEPKINSYEIKEKEEKEPNNSLDNNKDFFIVYENVKNGVIKLEELMIDDLIKVQLMMKNELDCIDEKINISKDEINSINNKIDTFQEENKIYYAKLQNNN